MSDERPPLDKAVCHALYSAANATLQLYRDLLAPWGLTYQQLLVLGLLWEEGTVTPGRIGEALLIDTSSVAGLLRRLQRDGLVERDVDAADRRRVLVTATAKADGIRSELGFLEECMIRAVDLDEPSALALIDQLHALRSSLAAFPRPEPALRTA